MRDDYEITVPTVDLAVETARAAGALGARMTGGGFGGSAIALVRDGDWMSGTGFEATLSLMREARPPTAIFCANDLMALGAMEALAQLGLKVPEHVSLMGYDDQEISRHTHPPLTTMVLPNYEMGRAAVEALLAAADLPPPQRAARRHLIKIDCPLVARQTVRPR